jgi:hypothetical protein
LEAAQRVFKLYPHWVYCQKTLYVFDDEEGLYSTDLITYLKIISRYADKLMLLTSGKNDEILIDKHKSYGNTYELMKRLPNLINTLCKNDDWLISMRDTGLKKLLFLNGYYDATEIKFYHKEKYGFNPKILFMDRVPHNFEFVRSSDIEFWIQEKN